MPAKASRQFDVAVSDLRKACDTLSLQFERSHELADTTSLLGQQRAVDAIEFGIQIDNDGYNVVVLGQPGSHRHALVKELVGRQAEQKTAPRDWCYVNNFGNPEHPKALNFSAGDGAIFRDAMHRLIEEMKLAVPAAFEGDDYRSQLRAVEEKTQAEIAKNIRRRLGRDQTNWRCGTFRQTSSATWRPNRIVRFWAQLGQMHRCLQEKATRNS